MDITPQTRSPRKVGVLILGSLMGAVIGSIFFRLLRYAHKLSRQPRLVKPSLSAEIAGFRTLEAQAGYIATQNLMQGVERRRLLSGQEKLILNAGVRNFREPWARDFGFATYGLLSLGEFQIVRECLEVFFLHQKPDGQFPVKIHSNNNFDRFMYSILRRQQPIEAPLRPKYFSAHNTISLDGNALLVIATLNYLKKTNDHHFADNHWPSLKRTVQWLRDHARGSDGLLHQGVFSDWADTIARQGKILYTNVIYWQALKSMVEAADLYGSQKERETLAAEKDHVWESINKYFWRPDLGFYVTSHVFDNLSSSGNLLAIAWGLALDDQANSILDAMQTFKMAEPVPTRAVHRPYPNKFIALENRLAGVGIYHTEAAWLWIGAWHIIALLRMRRLEEASELVRRMAAVIVRDGEVHEVYSPFGDFLSSFWYTSEAPLTWSAGMLVYACYMYEKVTHACKEGDKPSSEKG